jgi:putative ABC transport system permease protein
MYLITNAIKNLARNKGRNIMIASVTLAIIIGTVVTLTINNAAARVIDVIRLDIGSRATIEQDIMGMLVMDMDLESNTQFISINDFIMYADSEYLSNAVFNVEIYNLRSSALSPPTIISPNSGETEHVPFRMKGTSEPCALPLVITEGRMFSGINEGIICDETARLNNISIGDIVDIVVVDLHGVGTDKIYQLTIIGIYSADAYERSLFRFTDIFTSFDTIAAAGWESNLGLSINVEYFLRNPDHLRSFEREVREKGLPVTYNVSINQAAYDRVAGPMLSMKSAVVTFTIVILILGAIVLSLISFLAVRERKYEVGVLRAMGMEKGKVAFGIFTEAVMITALCLVIGLFAGSVAAQPIADTLLSSRVIAAEVNSIEAGHDRYFQATTFGGQMQTVSRIGYVPESEIIVNVGLDVIIQIIIITLCLAALSGIIGVVIITQYEPLKILRERA